MTTDEKFDIIINKLTNLEDGQKSLEGSINGLEEGQDSLFKGQKSLEEGQKSLEEGQKNLREELLDFKSETELSFENTNKLINQAFEKISENISYQDKVTEIEKIIHSRQKRFA